MLVAFIYKLHKGSGNTNNYDKKELNNFSFCKSNVYKIELMNFTFDDSKNIEDAIACITSTAELTASFRFWISAYYERKQRKGRVTRATF